MQVASGSPKLTFFLLKQQFLDDLAEAAGAFPVGDIAQNSRNQS